MWSRMIPLWRKRFSAPSCPFTMLRMPTMRLSSSMPGMLVCAPTRQEHQRHIHLSLPFISFYRFFYSSFKYFIYFSCDLLKNFIDFESIRITWNYFAIRPFLNLFRNIPIRENPLVLYIFTTETEVLDLFVNGTQSGGLCVNDTIMHYAGKTKNQQLYEFYLDALRLQFYGYGSFDIILFLRIYRYYISIASSICYEIVWIAASIFLRGYGNISFCCSPQSSPVNMPYCI